MEHLNSRPHTSEYDGVPDCRIAHNLYIGETDCSYGCLGNGDCVRACAFDAMYMDNETGLPVIIDDKCVSCGACVKACPRNLIELRKKAKKTVKFMLPVQTAIREVLQEEPVKLPALPAANVLRFVNLMQLQLKIILHILMLSNVHSAENVLRNVRQVQFLRLIFLPENQRLKFRAEAS